MSKRNDSKQANNFDSYHILGLNLPKSDKGIFVVYNISMIIIEVLAVIFLYKLIS